jgi:hypothetical protein
MGNALGPRRREVEGFFLARTRPRWFGELSLWMLDKAA